MTSFRSSMLRPRAPYVLTFAMLWIVTGVLLPHAAGVGSAMAQEAASPMGGPYTQPPEPQPQPPATQATAAPVVRSAPAPLAPLATYDKALFQKLIPPAQLAFLNQFVGAPANDLFTDKQFRKLMKDFVPDCIFHYGRDKQLSDALQEVIGGSSEPVQIRDGRYLLLSGQKGQYLAGKGFLWIDLQDGIALGGFYFHPTNGEPTPSVNIFSRQVVKQDSLALSELPPAFIQDANQWSWQSRVPPLTTRYFITGSNKKILLEHDEDYCSPSGGMAGTNAAPQEGCEQMNADASDTDMNAASYLEQTHHATNATAWMINEPDQIAWIHVRDDRCGIGPDPLGCHIHMNRERTRVIVHRGPAPHPVGRR
jgi:uncharacterized protein YecT (DUF1311 family)